MFNLFEFNNKLNCILENIFSRRDDNFNIKHSRILDCLGIHCESDCVLDLIGNGSTAWIYQHPREFDKIIKVTSDHSDILNLKKAQKLDGYLSVPRLYNHKKINKIASVAVIDKVFGEPLKIGTNDFYSLVNLNHDDPYRCASNFILNHNYCKQVMRHYGYDNDDYRLKFSILFETIHQLSEIGIDLVDFDSNIIDDKHHGKFVIIDFGVVEYY